MNETTSPSYIYIEEIQGFKKTLRPKNSNVGFALEMLLVRCGGLLDHCWLLYRAFYLQGQHRTTALALS